MRILRGDLAVTILAALVAGTAFSEDGDTMKLIRMAKESEKISMNFDSEGFDFDIAEGPFQPDVDSFAQHYA